MKPLFKKKSSRKEIKKEFTRLNNLPDHFLSNSNFYHFLKKNLNFSYKIITSD